MQQCMNTGSNPGMHLPFVALLFISDNQIQPQQLAHRAYRFVAKS